MLLPGRTSATDASARSCLVRKIRPNISDVEDQRSRGREIVYSVPLKTRIAWLMESFHGTRLRIQIVIQVEDGALNISDAPQVVLGYIRVQHRFGTRQR